MKYSFKDPLSPILEHQKNQNFGEIPHRKNLLNRNYHGRSVAIQCNAPKCSNLFLSIVFGSIFVFESVRLHHCINQSVICPTFCLVGDDFTNKNCINDNMNPFNPNSPINPNSSIFACCPGDNLIESKLMALGLSMSALILIIFHCHITLASCKFTMIQNSR